MSQVARWFDRKFDLSFSDELYPNLCVRVRGTPARLEELLRDVPGDILTRNVRPKWSVQEHAGHLLDLEDLWKKRAEQYVKGEPELAVTDLENTKTNDANHNAQPLWRILGAFRRARTEFVTQLSGYQPEFFGRTALHPRLKTPLRLVDHLYFVAEHDDHHLARIWAMINE
jgi:uncharacterized damage-inducible protein DinB